MGSVRSAAFFVAGVLFASGAAIAIDQAAAAPGTYSPYRKLDVFARVLGYIENHYVEHVDDTKLVYAAVEGMMKSLDPHSVFMAPELYRQLKAETEGEFGGVGIEVEIRKGWITVVAPLDGTPAHRAGIKSGDRIIEIEGKSTEDMRMDEAVRLMRGPRGSRVKVKITRKGENKPLAFSLLRDLIKLQSVSHRRLAAGVGYVRVKSFQERTSFDLKAALEALEASPGGLKGLVLDLRNNPGGLLDQAVRVADLFIKEGLIVRTIGKGGREMDRERAHASGTFGHFPIVCLVNGGSASASEIVAGALQDHRRAVVMGTQTFGKGSVQTIIELKDGSGLKLTVARYYTPAGRSIQEQGIVPDILVQELPPPLRKETSKRERDLKGHLRNANLPKAQPKLPRLDDFQLQTALDYLRAATIFRQQAS